MKGFKCLGFAAVMIMAGQATLAMAANQQDSRLDAHERAVQVYAQQHGLAVPAVRDYQYGMQLDVRDVILKTASTRSCDAEPMLMTYKDSRGQLLTLRYSEQGNCPKFQG